MGLKKRNLTAMAKIGVAYVRSVVEAGNCIFHEVHQENDFGNDAFIELVEHENVRGILVAAQIKSGKSYCFIESCCMPGSRRHFEYWRDHSLPVIGIVYDPQESKAYWVNVSRFLKNNPKVCMEGPFKIRFQKKEINEFTKEAFERIFMPIFLGHPIALDFRKAVEYSYSTDYEYHSIGIRALFNQYRNNIEVWKYFVDIFRSRCVEGINPLLVNLLSHIPGHPDIFWHSDNFINEQVIEMARELMSELGKEDVLKLLLFMGEDDDFVRGSLGQCIEAIISLINNKEYILYGLIKDKSLNTVTRNAAAILYVFYCQEKSLGPLQDATYNDDDPNLILKMLIDHIKTEGYLYLY